MSRWSKTSKLLASCFYIFAVDMLLRLQFIIQWGWVKQISNSVHPNVLSKTKLTLLHCTYSLSQALGLLFWGGAGGCLVFSLSLIFFCFVVVFHIMSWSSFVWKSPIDGPLLMQTDVDQHSDLSSSTRHWTRSTDVSFAQTALLTPSVNIVGIIFSPCCFQKHWQRPGGGYVRGPAMV